MTPYTGTMVADLINDVDESRYQNYRKVRLNHPEVPYPTWNHLFGVDVEQFEKRYDREMSAEMSYDEWMAGQL